MQSLNKIPIPVKRLTFYLYLLGSCILFQLPLPPPNTYPFLKKQDRPFNYGRLIGKRVIVVITIKQQL